MIFLFCNLKLKDQLEEGRLTEYKMEEENLICYRFPHLTFCGCSVRCELAMKDVHPIEVKTPILKKKYSVIEIIIGL